LGLLEKELESKKSRELKGEERKKRPSRTTNNEEKESKNLGRMLARVSCYVGNGLGTQWSTISTCRIARNV
jgi:hypothetical protein